MGYMQKIVEIFLFFLLGSFLGSGVGAYFGIKKVKEHQEDTIRKGGL